MKALVGILMISGAFALAGCESEEKTGTAVANADAEGHVDASASTTMANAAVATELPLADAPRGHEMVLAPGAKGKTVLIP